MRLLTMRPNIVILDGYTLNPGDNPWDGFDALGNVMIYERTPGAEILVRSRDADILLTNKAPLGADAIRHLPRLRYIGVLATGYNVVDAVAARAQGVTVTNIPAYGTQSVAQHTFALILELARQVGLHAMDVAAGGWSRARDWCYWKQPLVELTGLNLGIIGYGSIGQATAELGRAFGMNILASSRHRRQSGEDVTYLSLEELLENSDVASLHCPLTPETTSLINGPRLALMKPSAFLVNTARGPLIDEAALAAALHAGTIAGAALDVLSVEPPPAGHPLLSAPRCLITPHQAWASLAARRRLRDTALGNLQAFLEGRQVNVVN